MGVNKVDLKNIDLDKSLVVFYQEQVNVETHKIVGAEAVARLKDEDGNIIYPDKFIPVLEEANRIDELDFAILEKVCQLIRNRLDAGLPIVKISTNFCRSDIYICDFSHKYLSIIEKYNIPHDMVVIEVTETVSITRESIIAALDEICVLQKAGIKIALDDFGTGYSSMALFENVPVDIVKLDGIFLMENNDLARKRSILRGMVDMFHSLNVLIICEYIENEDDEELLKEMGISIAQGYYYSKPISEEEFIKLL